MNRISKQLLKIANEINRTALDEQGDGSGFQSLYDHDNFEQDQLDAAEKAGKKYILHHKEGGLWRIQACKNFGDVKKGDLGGFVASENNLSHEGNCWVYGDAMVSENAKVCDNAQVYGDAVVYDNAEVYGDTFVSDNAFVCGNAEVYGKAEVDYDISKGQITE